MTSQSRETRWGEARRAPLDEGGRERPPVVDMFENYEHRGVVFAAAVQELPA